MKESEIQKAIIEYLEYSNIYVVRVNSGSFYQSYKSKDGTIKSRRISGAKQGTPDLLGCYKGKFFALEVKKDKKEITKWAKDVANYTIGGKNTKNQERAYFQSLALDEIARSGGIWAVVCSIADVERFLSKY